MGKDRKASQDDGEHSVRNDKNTGKGPGDINPNDYK